MDVHQQREGKRRGKQDVPNKAPSTGDVHRSNNIIELKENNFDSTSHGGGWCAGVRVGTTTESHNVREN